MSNISDVIEKFIIETLGEENFLDLSRNDLADFFGVAPSQINYVLSTRFNFERGYSTTSRRGGGGYIRLVRLEEGKIDYVKEMYNIIRDELDYQTARSILIGLCDNKLILEQEKTHIENIISPKALSCPIKIENSIRAKMMKSLLESLGRR